MAIVNINNNPKVSITIVGGNDAGSSFTFGTIELISTIIQDYNVRVDGGSPVLYTGVSTTTNITFDCTAGSTVNVEIEAINGGSLNNITSFKAANSHTSITVSALVLSQNLPNLEVFYNVTSTSALGNFSGNVTDLPTGLKQLRYSGTLSGLISDLPSGLETYEIYQYASNTFNITGNLADFPSTIKEVRIFGSATQPIGGSFSTAPNSLEVWFGELDVATTIDFANLPTSLTTLYCGNSSQGDLTITGSINSAPSNLTYVDIRNGGAGTTCNCSGDISNLNTLTTFFRLQPAGSDTNTITGNLSNMPSNMFTFYLAGNNTLTGDISTLPSSNLNNFQVFGSNTLSGNIQSYGGNGGQFVVLGSNTIAGDLGLVSTPFSYLRILGNNTIADFTYPASSNVVNPGTLFRWEIGGNSSLSSTEVDNILIHLDAFLPITVTGNFIILDGATTGARTAASDTAYNSLISKGYNITLN